MPFSKEAFFSFLRERVGLSQASDLSAFPDSAATAPEKLGWMEGFPPPPERLIKYADGSFFKFPQTRWSFSHWREFVPTKNVFRGFGPVAKLESDPQDLDDISFQDMLGNPLTWSQSLALNYTDGVVVLQRGKIIYERYFGALSPERQHMSFSVTKSFLGTLSTMLIVQGELDPSAVVTKYIPELRDTAYGDATVEQVMDMTVGVKYSELYADPKAEIWDYHRAGRPFTGGDTYQGPKNYYEFLTTLKKEGKHGEAFAYKTVNAEVLAWIVRRITKMSLSDFLSETIWSKIGAEQDAYFQVDSIGTEQAGGGLCTSLRDLARFGEMMRQEGYYNGQRIIPEKAVHHILQGGNREYFAKSDYAITLGGWSYHYLWWISHDAHNTYMARGIYGQNLYIDPKAEMVIARYASHPIATNIANDPVTLPANRAVARLFTY